MHSLCQQNLAYWMAPLKSGPHKHNFKSIRSQGLLQADGGGPLTLAASISRPAPAPYSRSCYLVGDGCSAAMVCRSCRMGWHICTCFSVPSLTMAPPSHGVPRPLKGVDHSTWSTIRQAGMYCHHDPMLFGPHMQHLHKSPQ
jgi:hypothetical protein